MTSERPAIAATRNVWSRTRVQLGGGLVVGVLLPYAILILITPKLIGLHLFTVSVVAGALSIAVGYHLFRSLVGYPGIRASYYIVPTFSSTFAVTVTIFFLLRLDYSRPLLAACYLLSIIWYYVVYSKLRRQGDLRVAIVPYGEVDSLRSIPMVSWLDLEQPDLRLVEADAIVADFHADLPDEWERFLADAALAGLSVYHVRQLRDSLTGRVEIEHLSENAGGLLTPASAYQKVKSAIDLTGALVLMVPIGLVIGVLAILIRLDSPGPIFFRQHRIGFRGHPFRMWKLRTMTPVAADTSGRSQAITKSDDQRITRIGRRLRRWRLDELPQIINIVTGDMSWIGPRPEAVVLSRWYQNEIPFYRYRHVVRPGITGWAQVNLGHVSAIDEVTGKLHYDFYYIANFSFWLDVLIAMRTIRTMATGFGAK